MGNCTVADVASIVLPPGTRPTPEQEEEFADAIDSTAKDIDDDADYVTIMAARHENANAAAARWLPDVMEKPKAKAKAKAKK